MPHEFERSGDQVFDNPGSRSGSASLLMLGGVGLIAVAIAGFILAIRTSHGQMMLHATTTLPTIIAIGLLARGVSLRNIPSRIVVGPDALEITTNRDERRYFWSEVGIASTANVLNSPKTFLRITDTAGRTIVRVDESFPDYRRLVQLVQSHVDAKPDDTALRLLVKKAKRMALGFSALGLVLMCVAVFIALETREKQRANALLAHDGIPGTGEVVRRFVAPNGVTKRLEYRIAGSGVKNVELYSSFWDQLGDAKTVDVVYVPAEPDVSRLAFGERPDNDPMHRPQFVYLLAAAVGPMGLFFLAFSPFAWKGYDLAFDDQRRAWKIKRHGRVVWASKKEALEG